MELDHSSEQITKRHRSTALRLACVCGALPLIVGSIALPWWWVTRSDAPIMLGIGTVTAGPVLVLIGLVSLVIALRTKPRVSRTSILAACLLLLINFPVAWGYFEIVAAEVSTNRYRFVNQSGEAVHRLSVRWREEQIGFSENLEDGESVDFFFSALDNGGEGPISFTVGQGQQMIERETGVMAFVFTKSHVEIILQPGGKYRVREQEFSKGRSDGSVRETEMGGSSAGNAP